MREKLYTVRRRAPGVERAGLVPFGLGEQKPHHFREMLRIAVENSGAPLYAWRVLSRGVCDGCALGTTGLHDWTIEGTHLCLVRLNLLRLNTMGALDVERLADVDALSKLSARELRDLGRLPYPMRRRRAERGFTRITWGEAISELGERLRASDPDRVAFYATSRGVTNEVYFALQKAARVLGSPHVDNAARLCHSPSTAAMKSVLGVGASTCSYKDWYGTDLIVFFGSNPANDQPVALKYLHEAKLLGTRVLVVNTLDELGMRRYWIPSTPSSALFGSKLADRFYRVAHGGDLAFALAVQKHLIEREAIDQDFVAKHTEGWPQFRDHVLSLDMDELVRQSGVTRQDVVELAGELAAAKNAVFVWSMGLTQHAHGSDTVRAVLQLGLSRGFIGREKNGLMPIRGHSGVQGGAEMGAYANAYPGGQPIDDAHADELERIWGFRPPVRVGMHTVAMLEAARRDALDVFYTLGGNFLDTLPQPARVAESLGRIPTRIHQDIVVTPQMFVEPKDAVYLLPARTRYEHRGGVTETTTERRVVFSPYIEGHEIGEAREEWWIPVELVKAARPERAAWLDYPDAAAIRRDIARTIPTYAPITQLEKQGDAFQWGGARLCDGGVFPLPSGRARFFALTPPERPLADDELRLSTRRGKQFNSMVQAEVDHLTGASRDHVLMNAEDMAARGLVENQAVRVINAFGEFRGRARSADIANRNAQMHWPEANVLLDPSRLDPGGLVPDYNAIVTVERA